MRSRPVTSAMRTIPKRGKCGRNRFTVSSASINRVDDGSSGRKAERRFASSAASRSGTGTPANGFIATPSACKLRIHYTLSENPDSHTAQFSPAGLAEDIRSDGLLRPINIAESPLRWIAAAIKREGPVRWIAAAIKRESPVRWITAMLIKRKETRSDGSLRPSNENARSEGSLRPSPATMSLPVKPLIESRNSLASQSQRIRSHPDRDILRCVFPCPQAKACCCLNHSRCKTLPCE